MASTFAEPADVQGLPLALACLAELFRDFAHPVKRRKPAARVVPRIGREQERLNYFAGFEDIVSGEKLIQIGARALDYEGLACGIPHAAETTA